MKMKTILNSIVKVLLIIRTTLPNNVFSQQASILNIDYVDQVHPCCWCWAACITMVGRYYGQKDLQLCEIVEFWRINENMGSNNCCVMHTPLNHTDTTTCISGTSFYGQSDPIGTIFQNDLNIGVSFSNGALSYSQIKNEIDNNRPIKVIVGRPRTPPLTGISYHSMLIIGYNDNGNIIHYIDPGSGYYSDSYSNITTSFCMGGYGYKYGYGSTCNYTFSSISCPTNLSLTSNFVSNSVRRASNLIECTSEVNNSAKVVFLTGSEISLNAGFSVTLGSAFYGNTCNFPCP
jgi:hypothetical protein